MNTKDADNSLALHLYKFFAPYARGFSGYWGERVRVELYSIEKTLVAVYK